MRWSAIIACAVWAQGAGAQVTEFGDFARADTRYGSFSLIPLQNRTKILALNGQPTGIENYDLRILGAFAYPGEEGDWLLVQTRHGGNMCPESLVLLHARASGVTRTGEFGACLGAPSALRVLPGRIAVDLPDPTLSVAYQTFQWDGAASFTVTPVRAVLGQGVQPVAGGAGLLQWVGQAAPAILHDPSVQARFLQIMDAADLDQLLARMGVANTIERRGNWILGSGCQPHMCNASAGLWGLRLSDGAPVAVFLARGAPDRWQGAPDATGDAVVRAYVEERRWK